VAVTASAAFPPFFQPVVVTPELLHTDREGLGGHDKLLLTDGGVYDNLGIRALAFRSQGPNDVPAVVSDASLAVSESSSGTGRLQTAWRAFDIASNRIYELEKENLQKLPKDSCIVGISDTVDDNYPATLRQGIQRLLCHIRTDLDRFGDEEIIALTRHGYEVAQVKLRDFSKGNMGALWDPLTDGSKPPEIRSDIINAGRKRRGMVKDLISAYFSKTFRAVTVSLAWLLGILFYVALFWDSCGLGAAAE